MRLVVACLYLEHYNLDSIFIISTALGANISYAKLYLLRLRIILPIQLMLPLPFAAILQSFYYLIASPPFLFSYYSLLPNLIFF